MHKSASNKLRCAGIIKRERKKAKQFIWSALHSTYSFSSSFVHWSWFRLINFFCLYRLWYYEHCTHFISEVVNSKKNQSKIACFAATLKLLHTILYINRFKQIVKRFALACIKTKERLPKHGASIAKCHSKAKNIRWILFPQTVT